MTKLNWSKARAYQRATMKPKPAPRKTTRGGLPPTDKPGDIWITVGPECPWNTTPGIRQVHNFRTAAEARAAGFKTVK